MAERLEPLERKAAEKRMKAGKPSVKFSEGSKGNASDKVAHAVGISCPTLSKIKAVAQAAKEGAPCADPAG